MSTDESAVVGVEVAVSGTTVALVDRHGRVCHRLYAKTLWGRPVAATLEPYLRAIDMMLAHAEAEGFRVCGWFRRLLFLTVNAVVGAAFVVDGKLERAAHQYVGHVCHIAISVSGTRCSCGKRGCINTLVSTDALQKMVQRALRRGEETSLVRRFSNGEYFSPRLLAEEALRGDAVALQVYSEVGRWLGAATARYIDIFEPDVLILGGGILDASELLLAQVRSTLMARSPGQECSVVEVVSAHLGADAALIGVAVPFLAGDGATNARHMVSLADVADGEAGDTEHRVVPVLDDAYPLRADVVSQQTRRRKSKSYQRQAG